MTFIHTLLVSDSEIGLLIIEDIFFEIEKILSPFKISPNFPESAKTNESNR